MNMIATKENLLQELDDIITDTSSNEVLLNHKISEAKRELSAHIEDHPTFPIEVFPKQLRDCIHEFQHSTQLPLDYYGLAALCVASGLIGNRYAAESDEGFAPPPCIYGAMVGAASIGKTPVAKTMNGIVYDIEKELREQNKEARNEWKKACREAAIDNKDEPKEPTEKELLIGNSTVERVKISHSQNPSGLYMFWDELRGWLHSMNKYSSGGGDEEFYLTVWSNGHEKVGRVGRATTFVSNLFVTIFGSIQPKVLKHLADNSKFDNGFFARILFAYPHQPTKPYPTRRRASPQAYEDYKKTMRYIYDLPTDILPSESAFSFDEVFTYKIPLENPANETLYKYRCKITDFINDLPEDDTMREIYGKMENYVLRFAIILHLLEKSCDKKYVVDEVTVRQMRINNSTVKKAIQLCDYFTYTSRKVVKGLTNPIESLSKTKQVLYNRLDPNFTTEQAVKLGEAIGAGQRRTILRFLQDATFFKKVKHGQYEKRWEI